MSWYAWIFLGIITGMVISEFLPANIEINGTIKQKGKGNTNTIEEIKMPLKQRKKRFKGLKNRIINLKKKQDEK